MNEDTSLNFHPQRDLSPFGLHVFIGHFDAMKEVCLLLGMNLNKHNSKQEYEKNHPDLNATETCLQTGYISLAVLGSQRVQEGPIMFEHAKVIIFLIMKGAPVDLPDIVGNTALHHLATYNRVPKVLKVLFNGKPNPNARDRYGSTPVHNAIMQGQAEILEMCLANGGDLDVKDGDGVAPTTMVVDVSPEIAAIIGKYTSKKASVAEKVEDKSKCMVCGKSGVLQCTKCRVARYCSPECQREFDCYFPYAS